MAGMDDVTGAISPAHMDDTALIMARQQAADEGDAARFAELNSELRRRLLAIRALTGGGL
jgi:hypothetical protein